jgi:quercetin dioxygenase-like cupin family protein
MSKESVREGIISMAEHSYLRTHDLAAERLVIDLGDAVNELARLALGDQTRRGVTLVKQGGLNVVLTHVRAGGTLAEHSAPGAATVQVLSGRVRVQVGEESLDVPAGQLIAFDARVRHGVEAIEDSALLLTLTDPSS